MINSNKLESCFPFNFRKFEVSYIHTFFKLHKNKRVFMQSNNKLVQSSYFSCLNLYRYLQSNTENGGVVEGNEVRKESAQALLDNNNNNTASTTTTNSSLSVVWNHEYWKRPVTVIEDILTMGACLSRGGGGPLITESNGNEQDFHNRFIEDRVLGEGEFGVVKLVHDMTADANDNTLACKTLRKGVVFKDNTIYSPCKTEVLQGEVDMLRTLAGDHYCMNLVAVYETSRVILMVTEYCAGGEMMEYISKQEEDLRTDDVSRIAFQMLDAINHCAQHDIIHRDIKPENVMFKTPTPGSDLRIIDFGSGTNRIVEGLHTTFAGSAFYQSPEMFQKTYTQKTDVWSAGVTLYVVVAGYPADVLQKAFNILQSADRDLRRLPNFPENMPDSFYDMLEGLLVYRHKNRKTAGEMLNHDFVEFHKSAFSMEQIAFEAQTAETSAKKQNLSVSIVGSIDRHALIMDYQKFQRSLTTLMATLLDKNDLTQLMKELDEKVSKKKREEESSGLAGNNKPLVEFEKRLDVIPINELKELLTEQKQDQVLMMINKLPQSESYNIFAYDITLLKDFVQDDEVRDGTSRSRRLSGGKLSLRRSGSMSGSLGGSLRGFKKKRRGNSVHSHGSLRGRNSSFRGNGTNSSH